MKDKNIKLHGLTWNTSNREHLLMLLEKLIQQKKFFYINYDCVLCVDTRVHKGLFLRAANCTLCVLPLVRGGSKYNRCALLVPKYIEYTHGNRDNRDKEIRKVLIKIRRNLKEQIRKDLKTLIEESTKDTQNT